MSARDDYPGFAWRADVTPADADPGDIGMQCRRGLAEIDRLRAKDTLPIDQIDVLRMVIGEQCRVESAVTADGNRTLTITTEKRIMCIFKGVMEFTWEPVL